MTRWARVTTSNSKRPLSATSWEDMKKGSVERADQSLPNRKQCQSSRLPLRNDSPQAKRKKNKKKKEYLNEDVNGFMEYLKQNSQVLHNGQLIAADCPAVLESQDMGTGICYRCGSTEHEMSKCRANVDPALGEFPFAKCFVCGEMGHLSRSCPDNTKGVYADDRIITVGRWAKGMSADYEDVLDVPKLQKPKTKVPKVVNF
uniref:CCHC-type domain-containing protein n=1 Tax=Mus musculus TaxID=10090 RepID=Q8BRH8_MOUSE|nr:unnamed protein product [Mus musculus]